MASHVDLPIEILENIPLPQHDLVSMVRTNCIFYDVFVPSLYTHFAWGDPMDGSEQRNQRNQIEKLFTIVKTIAENPRLANYVASVDLAYWKLKADGTDRLSFYQTHALRQSEAGRDYRSNIHRFQTLIEEYIVKVLLANFPNLSRLSLTPSEDENCLQQVCFPKLKHVDFSIMHYDIDFSVADVRLVAHFLQMPELTSLKVCGLDCHESRAFKAIQTRRIALTQLQIIDTNIPLRTSSNFCSLLNR